MKLLHSAQSLFRPIFLILESGRWMDIVPKYNYVVSQVILSIFEQCTFTFEIGSNVVNDSNTFLTIILTVCRFPLGVIQEYDPVSFTRA